MCIYVRVLCVRLCMSPCVSISVCICMCMTVCMSMCVSVLMHVCVCLCNVHVCICVCRCVWHRERRWSVAWKEPALMGVAAAEGSGAGWWRTMKSMSGSLTW